jgi:hypothetical protein
MAQIGCGVAQIVARRLALKQARVRISARHPRGGYRAEAMRKTRAALTSYRYKNIDINKKKWQHATNLKKNYANCQY